jgi:hypothetical protein
MCIRRYADTSNSYAQWSVNDEEHRLFHNPMNKKPSKSRKTGTCALSGSILNRISETNPLPLMHMCSFSINMTEILVVPKELRERKWPGYWAQNTSQTSKRALRKTLNYCASLLSCAAFKYKWNSLQSLIFTSSLSFLYYSYLNINKSQHRGGKSG